MEISRLSIEKILSHRARTFRRETISVPLISSIEKISSLRGLCQDFLQKPCLSVPKIFAGESFCAVSRKFLAAKKYFDKREGESIKIIRQKVFVSQCRKFS